MALLADHHLQIETVNYLETPPSASALLELCEIMGVSPTKIIRVNESKFKELGLSLNDERTPLAWCELLVANPILIERPIIEVNGQVIIARPTELLSDLLAHLPA